MNVIIKINGREAIPVRAIPFLTDWEMMYPDALANVLAGDGIRNSFTGLVAYLRNGSTLKELASRWWLNHVIPEMRALECRTRNRPIEEEEAYVEWKPGALKTLPARAFVWRDEYVERHNRHQTKTGMNEPLDFSPEIPEAFVLLVAEGFEDLLTFAAPAQTAATPAPVVPASDGPAPMKSGDGLPTKDIATIFDGVNDWPEKRWPRNLSSSKWLHPARTALGGAGVSSSMWNPLTLAQLLLDNTKGKRPRDLLTRTLKSRFNSSAVLMPWRDCFNEHFDTFLESD